MNINFAQRFKLTNIPPLENMTKELEVYYFPEKAKSYEHIVGEKDAYMKMLEAKKHGHH